MVKTIFEIVREGAQALSRIFPKFTIPLMKGWALGKYGLTERQLRTVGSYMPDLAVDSAPSSQFKRDQKFLVKLGNGRYRLATPTELNKKKADERDE